MTSHLDAVLMAIAFAYSAGYLWAWHRLLSRVEKHDDRWYDSYPKKEVIARYIEVFGRDATVSFIWPQKALRVIISIVALILALLLAYLLLHKTSVIAGKPRLVVSALSFTTLGDHNGVLSNYPVLEIIERIADFETRHIVSD